MKSIFGNNFFTQAVNLIKLIKFGNNKSNKKSNLKTKKLLERRRGEQFWDTTGTIDAAKHDGSNEMNYK